MTARCLCGGVEVTITPPLRDVVICHCSLCRRWGTLAGAYTAAPRDTVAVSGENLEWYVDDRGRRRGFCRACGSSLMWDDGGETISISAGALDEPTGLRTVLRIFTADAAGWEYVPDDVPHRDA